MALNVDLSEVIASVIVSAAVPTTFFIVTIQKLRTQIALLEYRCTALEAKVAGNSNRQQQQGAAGAETKR